ncbi:MAG: permease [Paracoccaceae bacterium]|nr:MAG: permease [Paracoccaceae bacterium]
MSLEILAGIFVLFSMAALGAPVAYAILSGIIVYLGVAGQDLAIAGETMVQRLFDGFLLLAVPLFIVTANIMNAGSISDRLLSFCVAVVGRFRGGLGHVNVMASLIFSGMSGSAVADAAGIGKLVIEMMVKSGRYSRGYAAAITAATATIGPIIPPSIPMVLYALVSNTSIGSLFLAGILPGLIMGAVLIGMNTLISYRRDFGKEEPVPIKKLPLITLKSFPALLMPVILLTCIYSGVTSPTEAAAIAALYAFILAAGFYRALTVKSLYQLFVDSARSSASVALVIGASMILTYVVVKENIPQTLSELLAGAEISPIIFLLLINLLILLVGCILDATVIILVIVPLFIPTCEALGIDLVHFGVLVVVNSMIGLITPPYGMLLFVINAVTDIPLREIIGEIWAFLAVLVFALLIMIFSPNMVLWLPRYLATRAEKWFW